MTIAIHIEFLDMGEALDPRPCVIAAWYGKDPRRIEFRGPPYGAWEGNDGSPAERLHDALEGWHASPLHAEGAAVDILPWHPDYERVRAIVETAMVSVAQ